MKLKTQTLLSIASAALVAQAPAAVSLIHHYQLGEDGTTPLDSVGSADFTSANSTVTAGSSGAPGSTSYLSYAAGSFSSGADLSSVPTDNYAFGGWFMVGGIHSTRNDATLFRGGPAALGRPDFILSDGASTPDTDAWASGISSVAWIGNARGTDESAVPGTWVHLAQVRDNGTATFYINGVAQTGTSTGAPTWSTGATLGSLLGTGSQSIGADDLRIYSFAAGEGADALAAMTQAVPEPSSAALLGLGGLALILRRRK